MISLDLTKSSEVRKAGDWSIYVHKEQAFIFIIQVIHVYAMIGERKRAQEKAGRSARRRTWSLLFFLKWRISIELFLFGAEAQTSFIQFEEKLEN